MEPDMAISMAKELNDTGCPIDVLHGDNGSTTSRLKPYFLPLRRKMTPTTAENLDLKVIQIKSETQKFEVAKCDSIHWEVFYVCH